MKIMLIEDQDKKRRDIVTHLKSNGVLEKDIIFVKNVSDFTGNISADIGLFIIDFYLPNHDDGEPSNNGRAILEGIKKAGKHDALLLAISSYPDEFPKLRELYEASGCILADFNNKRAWQSTLDHLLLQLKKNFKFDFIIFCALQEERNPYVTNVKKGKQVIRSGIDCYDITVSDKAGTVVLLPQMGLVNAAVTVSLCIDRFRPTIIGMSGICGGVDGRAKEGQLLVSSMVYEYQSGKWAADGFRLEPYQVSTDHDALTHLKVLLSSAGLLASLEAGFTGLRPKEQVNPEPAIFSSGSAVIADENRMAQIESTHRKVGAIDMEVFAVHRAAELSPHKPICISAKTVVDLCKIDKNDELHQYGSHISAKFMIKAIADFFSRNS